MFLESSGKYYWMFIQVSEKKLVVCYFNIYFFAIILQKFQ
uniref:Uncharacterized protein n=1 Tax=Anguilla anguilla TaxID=7936 RepID=A0A0E9WBY7_ANGAN